MPPRESLIAHTILQGFDAQYGRFLDITAGAQQRFEQADWQAVQQAMKTRIHLYDSHVALVVDQLRILNDAAHWDDAFWLQVKQDYEKRCCRTIRARKSPKAFSIQSTAVCMDIPTCSRSGCLSSRPSSAPRSLHDRWRDAISRSTAGRRCWSRCCAIPR